MKSLKSPHSTSCGASQTTGLKAGRGPGAGPALQPSTPYLWCHGGEASVTWAKVSPATGLLGAKAPGAPQLPPPSGLSSSVPTLQVRSMRSGRGNDLPNNILLRSHYNPRRALLRMFCFCFVSPAHLLWEKFQLFLGRKCKHSFSPSHETSCSEFQAVPWVANYFT